MLRNPMFLKHLSLDNVRSIEKLDLSFTHEDGMLRRWTLLLGENGTGKSTVLRAAALLLAGSEALSELLGDPDTWIRNGAEQCRMDALIVDPDGKDVQLSLRWHRGDSIRTIFTQNDASLDAVDHAVKRERLSYLTAGYGASRHLSGSDQSSLKGFASLRSPRAQALATLFFGDVALNPLESWAMDLHYRREEAGRKLVAGALEGLMPGVTFKDIDRRAGKLLFDTADGVVPLSLLSDGYQNVAAWCGDLLYRITESLGESYSDLDVAEPLAVPGLLLIDEIDLHLHPVWQRQLRAYLDKRLGRFQILATTHSAVTAQQSDEGELYILARPDPKRAPDLEAYRGTPRNLFIHQVFTGQAFGLDTVASSYAEGLREEYRQLRDKGDRSRPDEERLAALRQQVEELPDWRAETPEQRETRALLQKLERTLDASGADQRGS